MNIRGRPSQPFQLPYPAQIKSFLGNGDRVLVWALQPGFPEGRELELPSHAIPPELRRIGCRLMMAFLNNAGDLAIEPFDETTRWPAV